MKRSILRPFVRSAACLAVALLSGVNAAPALGEEGGIPARGYDMSTLPEAGTSAAAPGHPEPALVISRQGSRSPSPGPAEYFTGSVTVEHLFAAENPGRASGAYVTFSPGARTAWHTHPLGQTLVVTAGVGRVQRQGGAVEEIRPGDVVRIPPGVRHWHGAALDAAMTHLAIQEHQNGKAADWLEKVSEESTLSAAEPAAAPLPRRKRGSNG